jgi:hypothetical protein
MRVQFPAQVMRTNACLHADQTRRNIREPRLHLGSRPLLPQHDCAAFIETNDVERVLPDVDAHRGDGRS